MIESDGFFDKDHPVTEGGFSAEKLQQLLDSYEGLEGKVFAAQDGWLRGSRVDIPLPKAGSSYKDEASAPQYRVEGIIHRKLIEVIKGCGILYCLSRIELTHVLQPPVHPLHSTPIASIVSCLSYLSSILASRVRSRSVRVCTVQTRILSLPCALSRPLDSPRALRRLATAVFLTMSLFGVMVFAPSPSAFRSLGKASSRPANI